MLGHLFDAYVRVVARGMEALGGPAWDWMTANPVIASAAVAAFALGMAGQCALAAAATYERD